MIRHQLYQSMLLFPEDLTEKQQETLAKHLRGCPRCQRRARELELNCGLLSSLPEERAPVGLGSGIIARVHAPIIRRPESKTGWQLRTLGGMLPVLVVLAVILFVANQRSASHADAYGILRQVSLGSGQLYPYSGSSVVNFQQIPWYLLPTDVAHYEGQHRVTAHWSVRDDTHFRVDLRIIGPVLERGAVTVVMNGKRLTIYDSRTGTAKVVVGTAWNQLSVSPQQLLAYLQNGGTFASQRQPDPTHSISDYLAKLRSFRSQPAVHPYARVVGHLTLLGHAVDVVQFGPLQVLPYNKHNLQSVGWARVWVERDRPFVLQYREYGLENVHNVLQAPAQVRYRVTSIKYGKGPSMADLQYQPPVPVVQVHVPALIMPFISTHQGQEDDTPAGWLPSSEPANGYARLATTFYGRTGGAKMQEKALVLPYVPGLDVLYGHPSRWIQVFSNWHGQANIYVTGPYVLVQERLLAHGLPPQYRTGASSTAGTCRAWVGRYPDGQRWLSFQHNRISVVISTNSRSFNALRRYTSDRLCA